MLDQNVEREIIELTHEWMNAVGQKNPAVLDRILGDDFVIAGWQPDGRLADKQFYIKDCLMPVEVEQAEYTYDRWQFRSYDKVVIANCILECHALVAGADWGGVFLNTYVWINRDDSWQVVTCHSSPVINPPG